MLFPETVSKRMLLKFTTNLGHNTRISIPRACMDKPANEVREAMQALIADNIVIQSGGTPRIIRGAKRVVTTRTSLVSLA